jgi:hypothetical protein
MPAVDPNAVLKQFATQVASEFPELRQILDDAKDGTISEVDALREMTEIMMGNEELGHRFATTAMAALTPLRAGDEPLPLDHKGLILHKERGLPRLDPLVEGRLIERAQFDGDMPELRTGGKPRNAKPAVPIDTTVRNPAALGRMLSQASDEVAEEIAAAEPKRQKLIGDAATEALIEGASTALAEREKRNQLLDGKSDIVDVPSYRRGEVPAPRVVVKPSGSALLAMTPDECKQSTWKFLSTTQGRISAVKGIHELIEPKLKAAGFTVVTLKSGAEVVVLASHSWTVGIDGPGATKPAFSLVDTAAASIAKRLVDEMKSRKGAVVLEVVAVNTADIRQVGWAGRLLSGDTSLPAPKETL